MSDEYRGANVNVEDNATGEARVGGRAVERDGGGAIAMRGQEIEGNADGDKWR